MTPPKGRRINDEIDCSSALENVFYLDLGKHAVVIDSGYDHQIEHHLRNFRALGRDLDKVVGVLATHSHVDHTGGLKQAKETLGVPVVAHREARTPIESGDLLRTAAVIPEVDGWEFDFPACTIDHPVDDGDTIEVGTEQIRVIHLPGHTPDCVGYLWRSHFFTGDAVFAAGLVGWAHERWLSNYSDHAESMQRLIDQPVEADKFYCAHGPDFPYDRQAIPSAVLKTLGTLTPIGADPCNHTPRTKRRPPGEPTHVITLPS